MNRRLSQLLLLGLFLLTPQAIAQTAASKPAEKDASDADAIQLADRIQGQVETIRGLKFLKPVAKGIYDKERLAKFLQQQMEKEGAAATFAWQQKAYRLLGLIPQTYDMLQETTEILLEQIGGFYDPETKELKVMKGFGGAVGEMLMAHELCHALEDQHFDLQHTFDSLAKISKEDDDRSFAARAVVEGSATDLMFKFMVKKVQSGEVSMDELQSPEMMNNPAFSGEKAMSAPPIMVKPLMEAYIGGAKFLARGGFIPGSAKKRDQNKGFLSMPLSSEQVLHPEKYWDETQADAPQALELADGSAALGAGWKRIGTNVLGELGVAILTTPWSPPKKGEKPDMQKMQQEMMGSSTNDEATGWDGDRYAIYEGPQGALGLAWASVWDSEKDAREMAEALEKLAASRKDDGIVVKFTQKGTSVFAGWANGAAGAGVAEKLAEQAGQAKPLTYAKLEVKLPEGSEGMKLEKKPKKGEAEKGAGGSEAGGEK